MHVSTNTRRRTEGQTPSPIATSRSEDLPYIAQQIEAKIKLLEKGRASLQDLAMRKAITAAEYDKALAIAILRLRGGEEIVLDGHRIKDPPVGIIEKVAKGMVNEQRLAMDDSEAQYKLSVKKLDAVQAELNGYQSIFRHLETV